VCKPLPALVILRDGQQQQLIKVKSARSLLLKDYQLFKCFMSPSSSSACCG
jgi:hypothetical protein